MTLNLETRCLYSQAACRRLQPQKPFQKFDSSVQDKGSTADLPPMHRVWLYLTHMHSEALGDQEVKELSSISSLQLLHCHGEDKMQ